MLEGLDACHRAKLRPISPVLSDSRNPSQFCWLIIANQIVRRPDRSIVPALGVGTVLKIVATPIDSALDRIERASTIAPTSAEA